MNTLQESFRWVLDGIAVIPIAWRSKEPDSRALMKSGNCKLDDGGRRASWDAFKWRLPTLEELAAWFAGPPLNMAIVTGWRGLVVIDFDDLDRFCDWWEDHRIDTRIVVTSRGAHVYIFSDEPVKSCKLPGIDIKAAGGYVLAPPSVHPNGTAYQVLSDAPIKHVANIAEVLPELAPKPAPTPILSKRGKKAPDLLSMAGGTDDPFQAAVSGLQPGQDVISAIKTRFKILDFFPNAQQSTVGGRWWVDRCPLHDDHHPSLWIDAKRGICGCYSGCNGGRSMDVINLHARLNGLDDRQAIEELAKKLR